MAPIAVTLSDLEGHFFCLKRNFYILGNIACISYDVWTREAESAYGL